MKKVLGIIMLYFCMQLLVAQSQLQFNFGVDLPGTHNIEYQGESVNYDTNLGFALSAEMLRILSQNVLLGGGVEYQIARVIDREGLYSPAYNFIPVYLTGKLNPNAEDKVSPELIIHFGYDFLSGNKDYKGSKTLNGGLYYGFGVGIVSQSGFTAEFLYRVCNGSYSYKGEDDNRVEKDVTQTNFSLRVGLRI